MRHPSAAGVSDKGFEGKLAPREKGGRPRAPRIAAMLLLALSGCSASSLGPGGGRGEASDPDQTKGPGGCPDKDQDGVCNDVDNCPNDPNPNQNDADKDGSGNACDELWDTDTFDLYLISAEVLPIKANQEPWDWDGSIPGWVFDIGNLVALFYPTAATYLEILEYVDYIGPVLLEGTVPPDPYCWFWQLPAGGSWYELGYTYADLDTTEPYWDAGPHVVVWPGELVCLDFYDEDLVLDDEIGSVCFDLEGLQRLAVVGPVDLPLGPPDFGQLWTVQVEVVPY